MRRFTFRPLIFASAFVVCSAIFLLSFMGKPSTGGGGPVMLPGSLNAPPLDAIEVIQGTPKTTIAVFASPTCQHCKRLERELVSLENVRILTYLVARPGSESHDLARNIWCSDYPSKVYTEWMLNDVLPESVYCDDEVLTRNMDLANAFSVNGTPTVFFENGRWVEGNNIEAIRAEISKLTSSRSVP